MNCKTNFIDYVSNINLQQYVKDELRDKYKILVERLKKEPIGEHIIASFLQGSVARDTATKSVKSDKADIDIVVVTDFVCTDDLNNKDTYKKTPEQALNAFRDFLNKYYSGKWRKQGRSLGIEMSNCCIDLVPTALPSPKMKAILREMFSDTENYTKDMLLESYGSDKLKNYAQSNSDWKSDYLMIPDRDAKKWDKTHPLEQIKWANEKHRLTNYNYKKVVRALKWWNKNYVDIDGIKSYPLEHLIGQCCPNNSDYNLERAVFETINAMASYSSRKPYMPDRGVPEHDVFARIEEDDYQKFIKIVKEKAEKAKQAYYEEDKMRSSLLWREIFGPEFPVYNTPSPKFSERKEPSNINTEGRFA